MNPEFEYGNQEIEGGVNGIVYDNSQLSFDEAAAAAEADEAVELPVSTNQEGSDVTEVEIGQADKVEFDTGQLAPAITTIVEESKRGYKTTEFWAAVVVSGLTVLDGIPLPEKFEGAVIAIIGAAYILSRGLAKKGVPVVTPVAADEV